MDKKNNDVPQPRIKSRHIHKILIFLSPKRNTEFKKDIPRSITPEAVELCTKELNDYLREIVRYCEESLFEINTNPNSYYQRHRYNLDVMEKAIKKLKGDDST